MLDAIDGLGNKARRLEAELKYLEQQFRDRGDILKAANDEMKTKDGLIDELSNLVRNTKQENSILKAQLENDESNSDNSRLRMMLDETEKKISKENKIQEKKLAKLRKGKLEALEIVRCTTLNNEKYKETERVLLSTFEMMKKYVDITNKAKDEEREEDNGKAQLDEEKDRLPYNCNICEFRGNYQ